MITIDLANFKRHKEIEWNRKISWKEITEGADISRNTLARLLSGDTQQADRKTLDGLCRFFKIPPGPVPFVVYEPDQPGET